MQKCCDRCNMRTSRKFCQRGSNSDSVFFLFLVDEWEIIQIALKASHIRSVRETPFKWRFAGGSMMAKLWMLAYVFRGSAPILLRNPTFLWFFRGGGGFGPPFPLLDPACARSLALQFLLLKYTLYLLRINNEAITNLFFSIFILLLQMGEQWLSGRVLDSRPRAAGSSHASVTALWSMSKTHLS